MFKDKNDVPVIYTDNVRFQISLYGFEMLFGLRAPREDRGMREAVDLLARIYMSPQHAKAFAVAMAQAVAAYEAQAGPIGGTADVTLTEVTGEDSEDEVAGSLPTSEDQHDDISH